MNSSLQLGFFIQPVHPPTREYREVLSEDRDAVILADQLGFREAFIGEHIADTAETITSSLAFISSLADRCPRITFGTGVLPLPNYHPAMVAAQVAMVDHLVQGRLLLGVGPGVPSDAEALDAKGPDRRLQVAESLEQILAIWAGEPPYRLQGEFYRTTTEQSWTPEIGVGQFVKPFQRPHPPIVITSIRPDSEGPYTAGLRGWSGISATYVGEYVVSAHIAAFLAGRAVAGLSEEAACWRVARSIFVAEDETTAAKYAFRSAGAHGFYFRVMQSKLARFGALGLMENSPIVESGLDIEGALSRLVIAGTPEQVADQIVAFRERVGPFGTLLYTGHDWVNPELARRSMELMTGEVWPRVIARLTGSDP
jgi:alkanesulfonate monooxygenase SsuD/methylene tetrahydromethanopterin reductase-like flavin-dependent oxidoreductase (luciferase family)